MSSILMSEGVSNKLKKEKSPIYKKILYLYQRSTKLNFTLFKHETEDN